MPARITPLRLDGFEQLPKHARHCVFWEVDPSTISAHDDLSDPEFEKEAWLSMVMLEWGSCAQLAVESPLDAGGEFSRPITGDEPCLGYAFYAPPSAVPRARLFPTGPVGADAVLLTAMGGELDEDGIPRSLVAAVVADLVRRGVRALEAFGRTSAVSTRCDDVAASKDLSPLFEVLGDCSVDQCVIESDFLQDVGFTVVAPHPYFPRLRLELDKGLDWKQEVEAALERLLESAQLEVPVGAGSLSSVVRGRGLPIAANNRFHSR